LAGHESSGGRPCGTERPQCGNGIVRQHRAGVIGSRHQHAFCNAHLFSDQSGIRRGHIDEIESEDGQLRRIDLGKATADIYAAPARFLLDFQNAGTKRADERRL